jgi:putative PIN family toxin of toxin-antitoxin system
VICVTADTNIYISALNFGGLPRQFFRLAIQGHFELAVSPRIQVEIKRVLRQRFSWTREAVQNEAFGLYRISRMVHPTEIIDAVPDDPDDDRILECAVAAASGYMVTGDNDRLRLGSYGGIQIVRVVDCLKLPPG